ncbi:MAG: hypothetical protein ABSA92_03045 [Candidatus Bathyarchaeia archaeon]
MANKDNEYLRDHKVILPIITPTAANTLLENAPPATNLPPSSWMITPS